MAEMHDVIEEQGELETVSEEVEKQKSEKAAAEQQAAEKAATTPTVPEKYRGKTLEEVVKMHQEAEKLVGRHAQEVGEVRKLADELLKSQLHKKPEQEKPQEVDFFENPKEAIRQAVESNPKVLAAEQYALQVQREQARQRLMQLHPDFSGVVQEGEFAEWVKASKVRVQLFNQAEAYDVDAADELLSTYKALKAVKQKSAVDEVAVAETKARDQSLKAAAVDTGGTGESARKIYRRADLIRLKMRDPEKYDALADSGELTRAYQEGRVK